MKPNKKLISIISPTYNEIENVENLYQRVSSVMELLPQYDFEFLIIDNSSTDGTENKLKLISESDSRVKIIINTRNFGHIRSPYWGLLQTKGEATIYLSSDLQDPPELIVDLIRLWEEGNKIVLATKPVSSTNKFVHSLRRLYYRFLDAISDVKLIKDTTGFGIYDKVVVDEIRRINDPYPYFRGLICELGYSIRTIDFKQPNRVRGVSKNNLYTLFDMAMLGIISHSLVPLRIASILGIFIGLISLLLGLVVAILKLIWWDRYPIGVAPILIMGLMLFGIQFIFLGIVGEYIGSIHRFLKNRPIVVEKERINF